MKKQRFVKYGMGVIISVFLIVSVAGIVCAAGKKYYFVTGSGSTTSATYAHIVALTSIITKEVPEIAGIRVMETAGGVENTKLFARGELELTSSSTFETLDLYNGTGRFKGKPMRDARMIFNEAVKLQQYFVVKASGVTSLKGLDGKPFGAGAPGSGSERHTKRIYKTLGIAPKWYSASWKHLTAATIDGKIIGFAKSGGAADAMITQVAARKPIRFLGMTPDQRKKILALGFLPLVLKAGSYPGQDKDVTTVGYTMPWLIKKDLPVDLVYKMVKAVNEKYTELAKVSGIAKGTIKMWGSVAGCTVTMPIIKLHAGTYKYLKELGLKVPKEIVPPEAK